MRSRPVAVAPWVMRQLGSARGQLWPVHGRCCRGFQHGPRVVVHIAGVAGHDSGDGRRAAALDREANACCDGDKRYCGCDERQKSDQSPRSQATVRAEHACVLASP